jgi:hypothetical protein
MKNKYMDSKKLFKYLQGTWVINRTIINNKEPHLSFLAKGKASVGTEEETTLIYKEKMILELNNNNLEGHKEYKYILKQEELGLYNNDYGKTSLMFNLLFDPKLEKIATGQYKCKHDTYDAFYFFVDDNKFILTFEVSGPEKNCSIISSFSRENAVEISGEIENN